MVERALPTVILLTLRALLLQKLHQRSPHNGVAHATGLQSLLRPLLLDQHASKQVQDACVRQQSHVQKHFTGATLRVEHKISVLVLSKVRWHLRAIQICRCPET